MSRDCKRFLHVFATSTLTKKTQRNDFCSLVQFFKKGRSQSKHAFGRRFVLSTIIVYFFQFNTAGVRPLLDFVFCHDSRHLPSQILCPLSSLRSRGGKGDFPLLRIALKRKQRSKWLRGAGWKRQLGLE